MVGFRTTLKIFVIMVQIYCAGMAKGECWIGLQRAQKLVGVRPKAGDQGWCQIFWMRGLTVDGRLVRLVKRGEEQAKAKRPDGARTSKVK